MALWRGLHTFEVLFVRDFNAAARRHWQNLQSPERDDNIHFGWVFPFSLPTVIYPWHSANFWHCLKGRPAGGRQPTYFLKEGEFFNKFLLLWLLQRIFTLRCKAAGRAAAPFYYPLLFLEPNDPMRSRPCSSFFFTNHGRWGIFGLSWSSWRCWCSCSSCFG